MGYEFVGSGAEPGVTGIFAVADAVHHGLWVLDADADREGFGLKGDALGVESAKGIAGAVTDGEDGLI